MAVGLSAHVLPIEPAPRSAKLAGPVLERGFFTGPTWITKGDSRRIAKALRSSSAQPSGSNNNMASFGNAAGTSSLSGGWSDVAMTGLGVLNQWAGAKAQQKAQKQQLKMLRQLARLQGTPVGSNTFAQAANPMASITPSLGSTFNPFAALTGPTLPTTASRGVWDLPSLPEVAEGVFDAIGEGAVALGETVFGGAPVATTAVATRRASPPRIVGAIDNASGRSFFYRYVGAPILFRGDLTTLKTAKRAVSKFGGLVRTGGTFRRKRRC